jgi:cytoskeleton protein RodZ
VANAAAPARANTTVPRAEQPTAPAAAPASAAAAPPAPAAALPAAAPASASAPAAAASTAAGGARIVLRFHEDSWTEVYDANGTALYRDIATAGAVHELHGAPPLRLVLGNAAGVGINVNGRDISLGAALQATPNAQFSLDRSGRVTESP